MISSEKGKGSPNKLHSLTILAFIFIIFLVWFEHRPRVPSKNTIEGMHSALCQKLTNHESDFVEHKKINMASPSVKKTGPSQPEVDDQLLKKIHNIPIVGGGMNSEERDFLASAYRKHTTVFEWGMGASSVLANILNVKKLVSVDSAVEWVEKTSDMVNNKEYVFHYVDIGKIAAWGKPVEAPSEKWLNYSAKVNDEKEPFDVYLVDGRFRVACACAALLHAKESSYVFIHDFNRAIYQGILEVAEKVGQVDKLVKLKLKADIPRQDIENMYNKYKYNYAR